MGPEGVWVTGHGGNPPGQGPFLTVHLLVHDRLIRQARYETYQCPGCVACGKAIVALAQERTTEEAGTIKWDDMVKAVGPLPRNRTHCYSLALLALADALKKVDLRKP